MLLAHHLQERSLEVSVGDHHRRLVQFARGHLHAAHLAFLDHDPSHTLSSPHFAAVGADGIHQVANEHLAAAFGVVGAAQVVVYEHCVQHDRGARGRHRVGAGLAGDDGSRPRGQAALVI